MIRDWAFANLDREKLISIIEPENAASIAVAKKIGMNFRARVSLQGAAAHSYLFAQKNAGVELAAPLTAWLRPDLPACHPERSEGSICAKQGKQNRDGCFAPLSMTDFFRRLTAPVAAPLPARVSPPPQVDSCGYMAQLTRSASRRRS
jgi:hypothetical protein